MCLHPRCSWRPNLSTFETRVSCPFRSEAGQRLTSAQCPSSSLVLPRYVLLASPHPIPQLRLPSRPTQADNQPGKGTSQRDTTNSDKEPSWADIEVLYLLNEVGIACPALNMSRVQCRWGIRVNPLRVFDCKLGRGKVRRLRLGDFSCGGGSADGLRRIGRHWNRYLELVVMNILRDIRVNGTSLRCIGRA